jgi:hypothetical protein
VRRWRHLIVAVGMVPALVIYLGLVMQIADLITDIHIVLDFLFYAVAGLLWIPLAGKVVAWPNMRVDKCSRYACNNYCVGDRAGVA